MSGARWRAALALVIVLAGFAALAGTASAAYRHPGLAEEFGKEGTAGEPGFNQNGGVNGLAIDQTRNRLYVTTGEGTIFGYSIPTVTGHTPLGGAWPISTGTSYYANPGIGVDDATGNFYFMRGGYPSYFYGYSSSGALLTGFPVQIPLPQCGAAVNNEGLIAESDPEGEREVRFFNSKGLVVRTVDVSAVGRPCGVTFDDENNLYVSTYESGVYRFEAADGYAAPTKLEPERANEMAFDASRGILYLALPHKVAAYNRAGEELESFAKGAEGSEYRGIAVDEATGAVYIDNAGYPSEVAIYPGAIVPDVTTGEPVGNEVVSGHVDPVGGGNITECKVEYGETTAYGESAPCSPATPYTGARDVTATLTGLTPEQTYHYRIVAANAKGANFGADEVITPHRVNALRTNPADELTRTCATLHASFTGNGEETHYYFEYGETESYGSTSAAPPGTSAGNGSGAEAESYRLCGLTPGTTYHFRVVASNSKGTSLANDRTFRTVDAAESIATEPATVLDATEATLHASFKGNGEDTHYYFEYGYNILYGSTTAPPPGVDVGSPTGNTALSFTLTDLYPGTVYHYRIVASNAVGTSYGKDVSFKTPQLPAIGTAAPSGAHELPDGTRSVTLNGTVNPLNGGSTTWHFEYGPTTTYGTSTPEAGPVGTDPNAHPVSAVINELDPGTNYHYRLVAHNSAGTTYGPDQTYQAVPNPPSVLGANATNVGATSATINAVVRPGNGLTAVVIDYGMTSEYGQSTAAGEPVPADEAEHPVSRTLTGLLPNTTYHYRVDAINFSGVVHGPDQTFSTAGLPIILGESVAEVGSGAATFRATISPSLIATSYRFEYGPAGSFGSATASASIDGVDAVGHAVSAHVGGLTPGTKYQVRVVATNSLGATTGGGSKFTTAAVPAKAAPLICKKGQVKRKGKCVKKPAKKKKHKKKSGKGKKHGKGKKGGKR